MAARLTETYQVGDLVEVTFKDDEAGEWLAAQVVGHQPPGLWVQMQDGSLWFVTNTRRIRPQAKYTSS